MNLPQGELADVSSLQLSDALAAALQSEGDRCFVALEAGCVRIVQNHQHSSVVADPPHNWWIDVCHHQPSDSRMTLDARSYRTRVAFGGPPIAEMLPKTSTLPSMQW